MNAPCDITLSAICVRAGSSQAVIPFERIGPSTELSALTLSCEGTNFAAETNASLALIQIELQDLYRDRLRNMVAAASLIGLETSIAVFIVRHISARKYVRVKTRK